MRLWLGIIGFVAVLGAAAWAADTIPASFGDIVLTPMSHAHVQVEYAGKVIHIDPTNSANLATAKPADIVIVTDMHGDHMDPASIDKVKKESTVYVGPKAAEGRFPGRTVIISNGDAMTVDGITITTVPMYNLTRGPSPGALYHDKARGNGIILLLGGKRVYFAGDTECVPEIKALRGIDVAFMPMNLPFTMTPEEAADCVKAFKPAIVYPYHYRGMGAMPEQNQQAFVAAMKGTAGIEVRTPNFYPPTLAVPASTSAQQGATTSAPAPAPRPSVPPLMFKEVWKVPQAAIDAEATHITRRVVPASVTNPQLELKLYGQHAYALQVITHRAGTQDLWSGFSLWNGMTPAPVAFLLRDKNNFADLTGLARMRAAIRTNGLHMLHPALKLADGTLIAGSRGITTEGTGFVQAEVVFDGMPWYRMDPVTVTTNAIVLNPDLSKVDEVGFVDLMPGGGPGGASGWTNTSTIELYARPVPR